MSKKPGKPSSSKPVKNRKKYEDEYAIGDENYADKYIDDDEPAIGYDDDEPAIGYEEDYDDDEPAVGYDEEDYDDDEPAVGYEEDYDDDEPAIGYDYADELESKEESASQTGRKSILDWCITIGAGAAVLILVTIVAVMSLSGMRRNEFLKSYADIGSELDGVDIVGAQGLVAAHGAKVSEAEALKALLEAEEETPLPEETQEATPTPANKQKSVVMNLTSVQKDLKIKFVNVETQALETGAAFEISIVAPGNKNLSKKDDDKDGIIYLKDLTAGQYKVSLVGPIGDEYIFSSDPVAIKVKDKIEYKKIDIKDEIKSESEINVAKEDTAKNDTVVESVLEDTVKWSESSKTEVSPEGEKANYIEISKDEIADPADTAYLGMKLLSHRYEPDDEGETKEEPEGEEGNEEEPTPTEKPTEKPSPSEKESASPDNTVSPSAEKSPSKEDVTPTPTPSEEKKEGEGNEEGATPSATPDADKKEKAKEDHESTLKTRDGKIVYVYENDNFREAKFADYYTFEVFYCKESDAQSSSEYKYTGWQHLDGYTYFFGEDGLFVTGEQVIQGAKYTFDEQGHLTTGSGVLGIDVSKWNGSINWDEVRKSGVNYVIIRCGYRGSSVGALVEDPSFKSNISGAQKAGLKVGVYFFSQAVNEVEAVEEASMVLSLVSGYNLTYPIFLDVEKSGGRADSMSVADRTLVCEAFCKTISNSGYKSGIYANKTWFNEKINTPALAGYKIWLAQYSAAPTYTRTRYDMWQYSSKGTVGGIKGDVDMNISYLGY